MNDRSFFLILLFCLSCSLLQARTAHFSSPEYSFTVQYSDDVSSGDTVLFNMTVTPGTQAVSSAQGSANIKLIRNITGKSPGESELFSVSTSPLILFGAIPLSTYLEEGSFALHVSYHLENENAMTFSIPVTIHSKDFYEEVIPLNSKNTAIKTDNSPERTAQIDKLNTILETIDPNAVYYDGSFELPVSSTRRTAFFGDRRTYAYTNGKKETSLHYGIDFGVPEGTDVHACCSGKVVLAEWRNSTGWSIVIEHLPGLYSLYYHLSSMLVSEGEIVEKGKKIALSGSTGLATGPHLHWEIRLFMDAVNPDQFVEIPLF